MSDAACLTLLNPVRETTERMIAFTLLNNVECRFENIERACRSLAKRKRMAKDLT